MALCAWSSSDQPARSGARTREATCGPRRPKVLVMGTQGHGEHPAAASRRRTLGTKYRTTRREGEKNCQPPLQFRRFAASRGTEKMLKLLARASLRRAPLRLARRGMCALGGGGGGGGGSGSSSCPRCQGSLTKFWSQDAPVSIRRQRRAVAVPGFVPVF